MSAAGDRPRRQFWSSRRGSTRLSHAARAHLAEALPKLGLDVPERGLIDVEALFEHAPDALWLEIGFGGGEHLAGLAAEHRRVGLIGVEPYVEGVAKLLRAVQEQSLDNVRVCTDDARRLIDALPDGCLDRLYVLFPDPWPKARHHKRRIVNPSTAAEFARLLKPGAEVRLATDDTGYAEAMEATLNATPGLERVGSAWEGWRPTRYAEKAAAAGRDARFFRYVRV